MINAATYRQLLAHADKRRTTVAVLLSQLADASIKPVPQQRRKWVRLTPEQRAQVRAHHARGHSIGLIASLFGVSHGTVRNILKEQS